MSYFECERLYIEFWDVPEENEKLWIEYYDNVVIPALKHVEGFAGSMIFRQAPPYSGGPERVVSPHWGVRTLGVRTDAAINLGALLQHEYRFIVLLFMKQFNINVLPEFLEGWKKVVTDWKQKYPGWRDSEGANWLDAPYLENYLAAEGKREEAIRVVDIMSRDFFSLAANHWDSTFDAVLSRVPMSSGSADAT